ncbi:hypothetical protein SJ05684_a40680 (plasmid) [Sinorhizobium sojae CCBAU 05684]|uniref:Uncharacterized protein n=1 Tax=Sinorhizobium sojae CCBAU 05684 TaxID=716928 RepID=A0A249PN87_9HYPH|nr:hypothetical protein SJ05684_a40680 [Sinorhizobium sojae CCBAU 05684]
MAMTWIGTESDGGPISCAAMILVALLFLPEVFGMPVRF